MKQMDRRAWRFKRATLGIGLALVLLSNAVLATPGRAQQCDCGTGCVGPCPEPIPVLETLGGNSLFWHDPCGNGYRDPDRDCLFHDSAPPVWYVSAEFLPLFRDQSGSQPFQAIAIPQTNATTTYNRVAVLSTSDFDTGFDPGIRATIGRALGDWYRLEGSYFGSYSWSDYAEVRYNPHLPGHVEGNMLSPLSNFGNPGGLPGLDTLSEDDYNFTAFDNNRFASIRFRSRLDNGEINLRRRVRTAVDRQVRAETSCLVGLRYMDIRETFEYRDSNVVSGSRPKNHVTIDTGNQMFGVQIGALSQFLVVDRGWIDFEIKGVMFFNEASNRIDANFYQAPTSAEKHRTSFMGDLSLNFNYQFAPAWTFRAGYNAMWLSGVALASENFLVDVNTLVTGPGSLNHSGDVVYHGPSIGLVFAR
jgi:hypothetical protein